MSVFLGEFEWQALRIAELGARLVGGGQAGQFEADMVGAFELDFRFRHADAIGAFTQNIDGGQAVLLADAGCAGQGFEHVINFITATKLQAEAHMLSQWFKAKANQRGQQAEH